jgi:hypothetical protein
VSHEPVGVPLDLETELSLVRDCIDDVGNTVGRVEKAIEANTAVLREILAVLTKIELGQRDLEDAVSRSRS